MCVCVCVCVCVCKQPCNVSVTMYTGHMMRAIVTPKQKKAFYGLMTQKMVQV